MIVKSSVLVGLALLTWLFRLNHHSGAGGGIVKGCRESNRMEKCNPGTGHSEPLLTSLPESRGVPKLGLPPANGIAHGDSQNFTSETDPPSAEYGLFIPWVLATVEKRLAKAS
jgi:hypothetical protein